MADNTNQKVVSAIETIVDRKVKTAGFNKTRDGIVEFVNPNNTYRINLDGNVYDNVVMKQVKDVGAGDIVRVHIPNNNPSQMYVEMVDLDSKQNKLVAGSGININQNTNVISANPTYEFGSNSGWTWKKYSDGTFDAWVTKSNTVSITTASNPYNGYRTASAVMINIPTELQSFNFDMIIATKKTANAVRVMNCNRIGNQIGGYWASGVSDTSATAEVYYYIHGTWS